MRIQVLSDLHLEFDGGALDPPEVGADVVVLAGDIWLGDRGVLWARERFAVPVIYVAGNHEYYGAEFHAVNRALRLAARGSNVRVLDEEEVVIDGVRFLGAPLWTDFALDGDERRDAAMRLSLRAMTDYQTIAVREDERDRRLDPVDTLSWHRTARAFLESGMGRAHPGPTVVVTHHLPSLESIAQRWRGSPLNAAFASRLDTVIQDGAPALWIHGHTHDSCDYRLGATRVVCNPRGYFGHEVNPRFEADKVVEVA